MGQIENQSERMENSALIDASQFADSFNAFWNENAPTCEHFIRRLNTGGLTRFEPPMSKTIAANRAVIAEFGFSMFVEFSKASSPNDAALSREEIERLSWTQTRHRLSAFASQGMELSQNFTEIERHEVKTISESLYNFFTKERQIITLRPVFAGCGYVDASEGDVISDDVIYEVKTVERPFRSIDLRQVLTYAALNFSSRQFDLKKVGLLNPRSGLFCELLLDVVCEEISGKKSEEFLSTIVETISGGEFSR